MIVNHVEPGPSGNRNTVFLANSIGVGLAHYADSLDHVLGTCGVSTRRLDVDEPSSSGSGRVRWVRDYLSQARRVIHDHDPAAVIAAWPALGYWDLPLLTRIAGGRPVYVVMHDPQPLVYARGYGKLAMAAGIRSRKASLLAHSPDAAKVIREDARFPRVFEVLHPMLVPQQTPVPAGGSKKTIRVLGQYKADRDIAALSRLAADADPTFQLEIVGRGWPAIAGWQIRDEFVSEESFDHLLKTSSAVLIPYKRFFQSGVAVRALEWGVPVVGPYESSLRFALGGSCPWLVHDGDWSAAVHAAVADDNEPGIVRANRLYEAVIADWSKLLSRFELTD